MVRDIEIHGGKDAPANNKAVKACSTGMGVVLDRSAKTFDLPSAATSENIYVVHKERIPTGLNAAATDLSDYFEEFNTVAEDEFAPLYTYDFGEQFATDQFDNTTLKAGAENTAAAVGTDGKWTAASGASKYRFVGIYNDAGHELAQIEVLADAVS